MAAVKATFEQGVAFSNEGKFDEAVAKFNEVLVKVPKCIECQTNIAAVYMRKKEYDPAEAAYKKAIEINPSSAEAYMGLANVYNAQKKFDQATEAGAQAQKLLAASGGGAAGGANASAVFNQGVIAWNAGKIPDAQKLFEQAVAADPEDGRGPLLARHGQGQPGQAPRGRQVLRGVLEARCLRPVRRTGEGHADGDQEVVQGSGFKVQGSRFRVR